MSDPRPTDAEIVAAYNEAEKAAGGPRKAEVKAVLTEVAERLGVPYEDARAALLADWGANG